MRHSKRLVLVSLLLTAAALAVPASAASAASSQCLGTMTKSFEHTPRIRAIIADYLGIKTEQVCDDTDLEADLHALPMDSFEIVSMICEELNVIVPERGNLTTLKAIVEYVREAPEQGSGEVPKIRVRGAMPAAEEPIHLQRIYFATDRKPTGNQEPNLFFGGERSDKGKMRYGTCDVSIPISVHKKGKLERPSWYRLEWKEDPTRHIVLKTITPMDKDAFFATMNRDLGKNRNDAGGDTFVFVHGFNVKFAYAARRTAQMAYDLDFPGIPILYSWPSDGSFTGYFSDREDVEWSVGHLDQFLQDLRTMSQSKRIHLVAHSMGNQALLRTLFRVALRQGEQRKPLFENVILAAPDFDAELFTQQVAPEVRALAKRWTLYASDKDIALDASSALSAKRLGLPLSLVQGVDTVDATGIDVAPWSVPEFHSYYASKQRVILDLIQVLRGRPPMLRNLIQQTGDAGIEYWKLESPR